LRDRGDAEDDQPEQRQVEGLPGRRVGLEDDLVQPTLEGSRHGGGVARTPVD
jgi:hypothetical protein